jgi:hypothetical protein
MLVNFNDVNSRKDLYFPSVCRDQGSATPVMLATPSQAAVGQKHDHEGGQQQPWSSETPAKGVERHKAITKHARKTHRIEHFNHMLRQRVCRLVRETLSFSKKLAHYISAIKYFICHHNLTRTATLPALPLCLPTPGIPFGEDRGDWFHRAVGGAVRAPPESGGSTRSPLPR